MRISLSRGVGTGSGKGFKCGKECTVRNEKSLFQVVSALFVKHRVRAVLVGGYALIANKVQRMTFDIDFMMTDSDYSRIEKELLEMGYSVMNRQDAFVQLKAGKKGLRDLDFLMSDSNTIENLISEGRKITIAGEPFFVPSPMHLIEMKLHSVANNRNREFKDFPDVVQLIRMNGIDPKETRLRAMFAKYHLMDLHHRVLQAFQDRNLNGK